MIVDLIMTLNKFYLIIFPAEFSFDILIFMYPTSHEFDTRITFVCDDTIKWKHFLCYWPFVREIHRSPVDSPHKSQWRGALMLYLMCTWTNRWANIRDAGDLRCHRAHYYVTVMSPVNFTNTLDGSFRATGPSHSHEFTQTENKTKQNKTRQNCR